VAVIALVLIGGFIGLTFARWFDETHLKPQLKEYCEEDPVKQFEKYVVTQQIHQQQKSQRHRARVADLGHYDHNHHRSLPRDRGSGKNILPDHTH